MKRTIKRLVTVFSVSVVIVVMCIVGSLSVFADNVDYTSLGGYPTLDCIDRECYFTYQDISHYQSVYGNSDFKVTPVFYDNGAFYFPYYYLYDKAYSLQVSINSSSIRVYFPTGSFYDITSDNFLIENLQFKFSFGSYINVYCRDSFSKNWNNVISLPSSDFSVLKAFSDLSVYDPSIPCSITKSTLDNFDVQYIYGFFYNNYRKSSFSCSSPLISDTGFIAKENLTSAFLSAYKNDGSAPLITNNSEWEYGSAKVSAQIADNGQNHTYSLRVGRRDTVTSADLETVGPMAPLSSFSFTDLTTITNSIMQFNADSAPYKIVRYDISDYVSIDTGQTYKIELYDETSATVLDTTYISSGATSIPIGANKRGVTAVLFDSAENLQDCIDNPLISVATYSIGSETLPYGGGGGSVPVSSSGRFAQILYCGQSETEKLTGVVQSPNWTEEGQPTFTFRINDSEFFHKYAVCIRVSSVHQLALSEYMRQMQFDDYDLFDAIIDSQTKELKPHELILNSMRVFAVNGLVSDSAKEAAEHYYDMLIASKLDKMNTFNYDLSKEISFEEMEFKQNVTPYTSSRIYTICLSDYIALPKNSFWKIEIVDKTAFNEILDYTYIISPFSYSSGSSVGTTTKGYIDVNQANSDIDSGNLSGYDTSSIGGVGNSNVSDTFYQNDDFYDIDLGDSNGDGIPDMSSFATQFESSVQNAKPFFDMMYSIIPPEFMIIIGGAIVLVVLARILGR